MRPLLLLWLVARLTAADLAPTTALPEDLESTVDSSDPTEAATYEPTTGAEEAATTEAATYEPTTAAEEAATTEVVTYEPTTDAEEAVTTEAATAEPPLEVQFLPLPGQQMRPPMLRPLLPSRMPCTCAGLGCGCCALIQVSPLSFNRTACMNLTYEPYEFAVTARMNIGQVTLFERSFSGRNPPPLCLPVPLPFVPVDMCVEFFDIYTPGYNLHLCMDWEARVARAPVVVLHFDCLRLGLDGVALLKPDAGDGLSPSTAAPQPAPLPPGGSPDDTYDDVAPGRDSDAVDAE